MNEATATMLWKNPPVFLHWYFYMFDGFPIFCHCYKRSWNSLIIKWFFQDLLPVFCWSHWRLMIQFMFFHRGGSTTHKILINQTDVWLTLVKRFWFDGLMVWCYIGGFWGGRWFGTRSVTIPFIHPWCFLLGITADGTHTCLDWRTLTENSSQKKLLIGDFWTVVNYLLIFHFLFVLVYDH